MINTFGLQMKGLKKIAGESKNLDDYYSGKYLQISYDTETGDVLSDYHYSLGHNSWSSYDDSGIITVGNISEPISMQQLASRIYACVEEFKRNNAEMAALSCLALGK